jgi:predicted anti-sigma-YlaC factor YlaD
MKKMECDFEHEALAVAVQGRWPERVDAELRAHIAACEICRDVVVVASVMDEARQGMREASAVPDSGRVWRQAQVRARREATQAAGAAITATQVIAFSCAIALVGACFGATSAWFQSVVGWVTAGLTGADYKAFFGSLFTLLAEHTALAIAMAAIVLVLPAIMIVLGKE